MKKYFFVAFKTFSGKERAGGDRIVVGCSYSIERMDEALLEYYNEHASHKADKAVITSLTLLDKQTAAQLSENFTNAPIIDDGEKEEEKQIEVEAWLAMDENNDLWLYVCKNQPKKDDGYWSCDEDADCMEIDGKFFHEVQWSDDEPTKVLLVIDK